MCCVLHGAVFFFVSRQTRRPSLRVCAATPAAAALARTTINYCMLYFLFIFGKCFIYGIVHFLPQQQQCTMLVHHERLSVLCPLYHHLSLYFCIIEYVRPHAAVRKARRCKTNPVSSLSCELVAVSVLLPVLPKDRWRSCQILDIISVYDDNIVFSRLQPGVSQAENIFMADAHKSNTNMSYISLKQYTCLVKTAVLHKSRAVYMFGQDTAVCYKVALDIR